MKLNFQLIIFLIILPITNGAVITEINFLNNEFVEIYSNQSLNLSNSTIQDENIGFNNLNLVQNKTSNFTLIVGIDFLDNYNYSNLNCSIYSTGLTSPGKYGLKNSGENILINFSDSTQINFTKNQTYNFNINQSLNYINNSYIIQNKSPCLFPVINILNFTNQSNLTQNISLNISNNINTTNNISKSCNYNFKINPKENLTQNKIEFNFITNITNFNITYWVEDFEKNIVKSKRTTTNKNTKTYTPKDFTNIYFIKANLFFENCSFNDSKQIIHYSKENSYLIQKIVSNPTIKKSEKVSTLKKIINKTKKINLNPNSFINILNTKEILNGSSNFIKYEIYKGDTLKRTIYFYHNKKKIYSFQLKKYENKSGIMLFNRTLGFNSINITGIELEKYFEFNYTLENLSKEILIEKNLKEKPTSKIKIESNLNQSILTSTFSNKELLLIKNNKIQKTFKQNEVYTSKNIETKNNSFYLIFIGVTTMLSTLIFLW